MQYGGGLHKRKSSLGGGFPVVVREKSNGAYAICRDRSTIYYVYVVAAVVGGKVSA